MWMSSHYHYAGTYLKSRPGSKRCSEPKSAKGSRCFVGLDISSPTWCAKQDLIKNTKRPHKASFGFCPLLTQSLQEVNPWFSLPPLLLFHFLPMNGKTKITPLKSMALWGQSLCVGTSGKQEQRWLNRTLRDLEFLCPWPQTWLITPADCMETSWKVSCWTLVIHRGNCRLQSCLTLNGGSVNSDEILCKYLQLRVGSTEEVLTLAEGILNPIKPLLSLLPCLLLPWFLASLVVFNLNISASKWTCVSSLDDMKSTLGVYSDTSWQPLNLIQTFLKSSTGLVHATSDDGAADSPQPHFHQALLFCSSGLYSIHWSPLQSYVSTGDRTVAWWVGWYPKQRMAKHVELVQLKTDSMEI